MKDYTMRPKRQVPRQTTNVMSFVSITPQTDEEGDFVVMRRYEKSAGQKVKKVGESIAIECGKGMLPERAKQLVEEFRNTKL